MALRLKFLDGPRVGQTLEYGDDVERIAFGRDSARCRVVFPAGQTVVGREHFALRRELGRYRLVLNTRDPVFLDREPARDDQELPSIAELRVGVDGPRLMVETLGNSGLPETMRRPDRVPVASPGRDTMVRGLDRGLRRTRLILWSSIGCLGVVTAGVALAVGLGWWRTSRELEDINRRQGLVIRELEDRMKALREKIQPRVTEALAKASPSVYLVVVRGADGREIGAATAWVVGDGLLATNAHVAEILEHKLPEGAKLLVRSNADPPRDHLVSRAGIHPGYPRFKEVWTDYKPGRDSLGPTLEQLQQVNACDVGLLWVESAEGLAPRLEIADPEALDALSAGDVVGYVGYPMESMALGGVNVRQPTPQMQVGNVTAMTDFFLMKSAGGRQLVQNSLPIMGGASGSPILDAKGRVVAVVCAANLTAGPQGGGRISTGAGVNFGQRADLLQEMLEGKAEEAQKTRTERWRQDIRKFVSLRERIVDVQVAGWIEELPGHTSVRIAQESGKTSQEHKTGIWIFKHVLELDGECFLLVVAGTDAPVNTYVFGKPGGPWTEDALLASDEARDWYSQVPLTVSGPRRVEIVVSSGTKDVPVTLHAFRAKTE